MFEKGEKFIVIKNDDELEHFYEINEVIEFLSYHENVDDWAYFMNNEDVEQCLSLDDVQYITNEDTLIIVNDILNRPLEGGNGMNIEVGMSLVIIGNKARYHHYKMGTIVTVKKIVPNSKSISVEDSNGIQHYVHIEDIEPLELNDLEVNDIPYNEDIEFNPSADTQKLMESIIKNQQDRPDEDYVNVYLEERQFEALERLLNN